MTGGYGSIASTPGTTYRTGAPPSLRLPGPALSTHSEHDPAARAKSQTLAGQPANRAAGAYEVGKTHTPSSKKLHATRSVSTPFGDIPRRPRFLSRMLSVGSPRSPQSSDVPMEHFRLIDLRMSEFFGFLDSELEKVEDFYRLKEVEATSRLELLQDQLHEMKVRRTQQVLAARQNSAKTEQDLDGQGANGALSKSLRGEDAAGNSLPWKNPFKVVDRLRDAHIGKNSKALSRLGPIIAQQRPGTGREAIDNRRDFARRPQHDDVPYTVAKKKLKTALQEYYRGLELLKSYALVNRTAFRKINKKYDKALQVRQSGQCMMQKVDRAHFVKSDLLDNYMMSVESMYASYFERGNHKMAVNKLRKKLRPSDFTGSVFRNGLFLASGLALGSQALVYADKILTQKKSAQLSTVVGFLLQIYAGYFLALTLFLLFCLDCKVWSLSRINYIFVFEFDTRHNLDWRQLSEIPCFLVFLEGLIMLLNFEVWPTVENPMFLHWPILLIALTAAVLFLPLRTLYYRSRSWWLYSNFRLILAGIYPVEFRDFFLGDMYCSLTYAMGNIEVFFCLYARGWSSLSTVQCNSSHSRWLGFLACLPGIWRALQCLRRYHDTRNFFPHLVNCGKYGCTILFYMTLSIYRIEETTANRGLFIAFATINSIYCSIWDILMDWSLGDPTAPNPFLREVLGYKRPWIYYLAMVIDPILRFNWVFYAGFVEELQHSALLSFFVSLSEILRRGMWTLFRVENEHCTNVGRFRASRDVPLPYEVSEHEEEYAQDQSTAVSNLSAPTATTTSADVSSTRPVAGGSAPQSPQPTPGSLRRRPTLADTGGTPTIRALARVGGVLAAAHAQDYERKRRPAESSASAKSGAPVESPGSSDDDEDDDEVVARASEEGAVATVGSPPQGSHRTE